MSSPTPAPESEAIVITGTRTDIPLDQSPASISVVTSQDFEEKQIERVADALREVPGLSVVQTGTAGQLTSVFTRGLRSEHTQVLLDGIPINQGLAGLMNFADFTTDDLDRVEVVRGPQSTLYGPRALAGAIQIFTKRGEGDPTFTLTAGRRILRDLSRSIRKRREVSISWIIRSASAGSTPIMRARIINID
jgi:vitamin B12 transporter